MRTATNRSWLAQVSAIVLVIALTPATTPAQQAGPPQAVREFAPSPTGAARVISPSTGKAFNDAITALNGKRYDDARAAVGKLKLDRLNPFERGKAEQILFNVAAAQQNYGEARLHLQNAIASGGLDEAETAAAQTEITRIDARLATAPPG